MSESKQNKCQNQSCSSPRLATKKAPDESGEKNPGGEKRNIVNPVERGSDTDRVPRKCARLAIKRVPGTPCGRTPRRKKRCICSHERCTNIVVSGGLCIRHGAKKQKQT